MANFTSNAPQPTAGIHSANKTHDKPVIAARPIPPPTLPKYSSSFSKSDRDRNEFSAAAKIDRAERDKVCIYYCPCLVHLLSLFFGRLLVWWAEPECVPLKSSYSVGPVTHRPSGYFTWMLRCTVPLYFRFSFLRSLCPHSSALNQSVFIPPHLFWAVCECSTYTFVSRMTYARISVVFVRKHINYQL